MTKDRRGQVRRNAHGDTIYLIVSEPTKRYPHVMESDVHLALILSSDGGIYHPKIGGIARVFESTAVDDDEACSEHS